MGIKLTSLCIFLLLPVSADCQDDLMKATSILNKFLEYSGNGDYFGWNGKIKTDIRLDASKYEEIIIEYNKKLDLNFRIAQSDNAYYVSSYTLDSVVVKNNFAIGYITLSVVSHGYCMESLPVENVTVRKAVLLMKQNRDWLILSESGEWFVTIDGYTRWVERLLNDSEYASDYDVNIEVERRNYNSFKKLLSTNNQQLITH